MTLATLLGWEGISMLLASYALISTGRLNPRSLTYQAINIVAAIFLVINAFANTAWPFVALNTVWAIVGTVIIIRILLERR